MNDFLIHDDGLAKLTDSLVGFANELRELNDAAEMIQIAPDDLRAVITDAVNNLMRVEIEPFGYGEYLRSYVARTGSFVRSEDVDGLVKEIMEEVQ